MMSDFPGHLQHGQPVVDLPGFAHRFDEVNGTRIHSVTGGEGPLIVLVHGWPYTWALWRPLMPLLAAAGFSVLAPDLRGLGDSSQVGDDYSKVNVAEDIRQVVQRLGATQIDLVGTDIGTMVSYAYASRHPHEVRRLVLAESILPGFGLEERMNPATGGYWHFGFHMQAELATFLTQGKEEAYLLPTMRMMSAAPDAEEIARQEFLPYYLAPGGMYAGFRHYATLLEDGRQNRVTFTDKLPMPVLVLSGERGIPQVQTLASVQQVADQPEVDLVPGSGHTFALDNPTWVAQRLTRFFQ